ncbi:GINS complex, PSF2 component [Aspergillus campestris IBT 28561]|uniref:DNA replication complex GINS protein PSF2 n=2 Tax=Aspergillus subgen. Circumdati TaxID=2720871 RepID=A0A2I2EYK9_ASPCN|nr:GINS complex, PSF2 component [Aspergillus candidus]XP_024690069.1 GINS complex, PSF2 component [Aspergillus campestris IBT 28561]PKY01475.1 GINS complex, PSF2 component [Aspergillus campestris IBT 28561]PLB33455.1 GINS complex, PSF2 component [Aspergillus candidus]
MAFPLPRGITPPEISFLAEMEMVSILPRQRLEGLELLGGPIEPLLPPRRATLPLWLALLLKRQRRANILPPSWLHPESLSLILDIETQHGDSKGAFSPPPPLPNQPSAQEHYQKRPVAIPHYTPDGNRYFPSSPFLPQNVAVDQGPVGEAPRLPFHWLEVGTMLLEAASDDLVDPDQTRRLLKELREVRSSKMRSGVDVLDSAAVGGNVVSLTGVGAMEIGEGRGFISGVVDGLRRIGASKEQARREQMAGEMGSGGYGATQDDDDDDDMEF